MAYIGKSIESGTFSVLDTSGNTYNGSNVTFNLGTQVGSPAQLLVSHDGVIQKPGTDYSLATGGTQITFSTAPASGASIFIVEISGAVGGPLDSDLNGTELILDADGDTSITADTDDQIDVKIAGADDFSFTANTFTAASGSTIAAQALTATTLTATGATSLNGGAFVFNEDSADVDFRIESNGNANMLHVDGGNDGVGIGQTGNAHTLSVHDTTAFVSGDSNVANTAPLNVRSAASSGNIGAISIGGNDNCAIYNHGSQVLALQAHDRILFMCSATNDDKIGTKSERMRIASDGEVSINDGPIAIGTVTALKVKGGNGAPTCILQHGATSGEEAVLHFKDGDATLCGSVTVHTTNHTTAYNTSSDYRLKENVDYSWDATTRLKQLKPARFNWKSNSSGDKVDGFLAHEVSSVVPEAIYGEKDAMIPEVLYTANDELPEGKNIGDVKEATKINAQGIDQSKLVPLLVKTVLELEARIATLEG